MFPPLMGFSTRSWTTRKCLGSEAMDRMATAVGVMEAVRMRNPWCSHMGVPECQRISVHSVSETRDGKWADESVTGEN